MPFYALSLCFRCFDDVKPSATSLCNAWTCQSSVCEAAPYLASALLARTSGFLSARDFPPSCFTICFFFLNNNCRSVFRVQASVRAKIARSPHPRSPQQLIAHNCSCHVSSAQAFCVKTCLLCCFQQANKSPPTWPTLLSVQRIDCRGSKSKGSESVKHSLVKDASLLSFTRLCLAQLPIISV